MFLNGGGGGRVGKFSHANISFKRLLLQTIFNGASLSYLRYMYILSHKLLRLLHLVPQRHQPKYYLRRPSAFNVPICSTNRFRQSFLPRLWQIFNELNMSYMMCSWYFIFRFLFSGWIHLKHTRIAVAFTCWNFLLFLSLTIQLLVAI